MPETMSPREKVVHKQPCDHCQRMTVVDPAPILAALASSGDHAELARLCGEANAATTMWHADKALRAIEQICSPDYLLALIAEVAALRGENADLREHRITADLLVSTLKADKAEAESKLVEADKRNDRAADLMRQCTDPDRFEGASTLNVYANMRAWLSDLSKEAERG